MLTGRSYGGIALMSCAVDVDRCPRSGVSKPASIRSSVVLPEPEPPSRQKISPRWMSSDTSSTAAKSPNFLVTSVDANVGGRDRDSRRGAALWLAAFTCGCAAAHLPVLKRVHMRVSRRWYSAGRGRSGTQLRSRTSGGG